MSNAFLADLAEFAGEDNHVQPEEPIRIHKKRIEDEDLIDESDFSLDTIAIRRKNRG